MAGVAGPGFNGYNPASPDLAVGPKHVVMVVASSIDIRQKVGVSHSVLQQPLAGEAGQLLGMLNCRIIAPSECFWKRAHNVG